MRTEKIGLNLFLANNAATKMDPKLAFCGGFIDNK